MPKFVRTSETSLLIAFLKECVFVAKCHFKHSYLCMCESLSSLKELLSCEGPVTVMIFL